MFPIKRLLIFVLILVLIGSFIVLAVLRDNKPIFRKVEFGMTMDEVKNAEYAEMTSDFKNSIYYKGTDDDLLKNASITIGYFFNDEGLLNHIMVYYPYKSYDHDLYGYELQMELNNRQQRYTRLVDRIDSVYGSISLKSDGQWEFDSYTITLKQMPTGIQLDFKLNE